MKLALVQIDNKPEYPRENLDKIIERTREAAKNGAKIILFHENTLTDYVADVDKYAQEAPDGEACTQIAALAEELGVYVSFGLIEREGINRYITWKICYWSKHSASTYF